ncbi:MAG: UDP-2,3-diacylglucosamine diphosphatase [Planctomycetota bacterium]
MKRIVFFSDVHLKTKRGKISRLLCQLLDTLHDAEAVYILGDLFDFWIGPEQIPIMECSEIFEKIKSLADSGIKIYFLHGNRDFLLGKMEERLLNVKIIGDAASIQIDGQKVYLTHGDLFCENDTDYIILRHLLRFKPLQFVFKYMVPKTIKLLLARLTRWSSTELVRRKADNTMNISSRAVKRKFEHGYDVIICGHVHKPREVLHKIQGRNCKILVLGDWKDNGSYAEYRDGLFSLKKFEEQPINT